jgi:hypothetical protein
MSERGNHALVDRDPRHRPRLAERARLLIALCLAAAFGPLPAAYAQSLPDARPAAVTAAIAPATGTGAAKIRHKAAGIVRSVRLAAPATPAAPARPATPAAPARSALAAARPATRRPAAAPAASGLKDPRGARPVLSTPRAVGETAAPVADAVDRALAPLSAAVARIAAAVPAARLAIGGLERVAQAAPVPGASPAGAPLRGPLAGAASVHRDGVAPAGPPAGAPLARAAERRAVAPPGQSVAEPATGASRPADPAPGAPAAPDVAAGAISGGLSAGVALAAVLLMLLSLRAPDGVWRLRTRPAGHPRPAFALLVERPG